MGPSHWSDHNTYMQLLKVFCQSLSQKDYPYSDAVSPEILRHVHVNSTWIPRALGSSTSTRFDTPIDNFNENII